MGEFPFGADAPRAFLMESKRGTRRVGAEVADLVATRPNLSLFLPKKLFFQAVAPLPKKILRLFLGVLCFVGGPSVDYFQREGGMQRIPPSLWS